MEDKKLKSMTAQIKKTCKMMEDNDWLISIGNGHYSIGMVGPCVQVNRTWFHEMFEEYETTKLPHLNYEYRWVKLDGVTFFYGCDMAEEGED